MNDTVLLACANVIVRYFSQCRLFFFFNSPELINKYLSVQVKRVFWYMERFARLSHYHYSRTLEIPLDEIEQRDARLKARHEKKK